MRSWLLTVALAVADPTFHTARNLSNVARQVTIVGIIGVGMTMVILIAGIDLSVGSVVGVAAVVVTLLMQYGLPAWIAVPADAVLGRRTHRPVERLLDRALQYSAVYHHARAC